MDDSFDAAPPPAASESAPAATSSDDAALSLDTPSTSTADTPSALPPTDADLSLDAPATTPAPMDAAVDPSLDAQPANPPSNIDGVNPLDSLVDTSSNSTAPTDLENATMMATQDVDDQANNVNLASPVELRQRESALYGFSAGLVYSSAPLQEKYTVGPALNGRDYGAGTIDDQTDNIQSLGVMLRYAETPYYSLGTDLNISYSKSQNHSSITVEKTQRMSEVTTLKGELNLTYAIDLGGHVPLYFLAGLGAEKVTGAAVERLISPMGYGGQAGAGVAIASSLNLEAMYFYYVHRISNILHDNREDMTKTTQPGEINTEDARAYNQGVLIRGSYSFNF